MVMAIPLMLLYWIPPDDGDNAAGRVLNMTDRGAVKFFEASASGSESALLQGPSALASNLTFTLPATQGTNGQFLQTTDAGGTMAWGNSGTASLQSAYDSGQTVAVTANPAAFSTASATHAINASSSSTGKAINVSAGNVAMAGDLSVVGTSTLPALDGNKTISGATTLTGAVTASSSFNISTAGGLTTLQLSNTGANTGFTIGGDTNLYRPAASVLRTDDDIQIKGGRPWFDVRAFGATGDGTTNDTAALQAALDAAEANGGRVYFPRGTYKMTQQRATYQATKGVEIFGDGWESKLLWDPALDTPATNFRGMINISGTSDTVRGSFANVHDLSFDFGGSKAGVFSDWKAGLHFTHCDNITVSRCRFKGALGMMLAVLAYDSTTTHSQGMVVEDCYFEDCVSAALNPITDHVKVVNNRFFNCVSGIECGYPDVVCSDNDFEKIDGYAIRLSSVNGFAVTGNRIKDCVFVNPGGSPLGSIDVAGGGAGFPSKGLISNNVIINETYHGFLAGIATKNGTSATPREILISGNTILGGAFQIYVNNGNDLLVSGNRLGPAIDYLPSGSVISASSTDNSFNDSSNGFLAWGIQVNSRLSSSGFTNSANNSNVLIVTSATAGKIIVSGATLVTEAAGANRRFQSAMAVGITLANTTDTNRNMVVGNHLNGQFNSGEIDNAVSLGVSNKSFNNYKTSGVFDLDLSSRVAIDGWYQNNVSASQTAVQLSFDTAAANFGTNQHFSFRRSYLTGVWIKSNEARTAGTATTEVYIAGSASGLTAVLDATNTTSKKTTQASFLDAIAEGLAVDVRITTASTWAPTTADIRVFIEYEQND